MIIRNGKVITPTNTVVKSVTPTTGSNYKIKVAELTGVTFKLLMEDTVLQTKSTPEVTGGIVTFDLTDPGVYKVKAVNTSDEELWNSEVNVDTEGIFNVKVPDSSTGYALNRYTLEQLHIICQNGYFSTMFDIKSKYNFRQTGSIMNNYDHFVEDIEQNNGGEEVIFRSCSSVEGKAFNMNENVGYLASSSSTSFAKFTSALGGYKHSWLRTNFMKKGDEVYTQVGYVKPDNSSITGGTEFSKFYYTDSDKTSNIYSYDASSDTFTPDSEFIYYNDYGNSDTMRAQHCKFVKGYFKKIGTLTQAQFNSGHYYYSTSSYYTSLSLATTYSSSTIYWGLYETIQEDGMFVNAYSSLRNYMKPINCKSNVGIYNDNHLGNYSDLVTIPVLEEITGLNKDTLLFSNKTTKGVTKGIKLYAGSMSGEGKKKPAYDNIDVISADYNRYWTASVYALTYNQFCVIAGNGSMTYQSASEGASSSLTTVRPGFKFI